MITHLITFALVCGQIPAAPDRKDRAGFASCDITPPVGIDLGGRGCSDEASTEVLDPLQAQATVLRDANGQALVIVSLDLIGLGQAFGAELRERIASEVQVPPDTVLLNCSHTHSGPMMYREAMAACGEPKETERAYLGELLRRVVKMCVAAADDCRPVRVTVHEGKSDVGINRRGRARRERSAGEDSGGVSMIPNPDAPYDPRVWVLRLDAPDGTARGVLFSYACHPVMVYGFARRAISGEYPSVARREIREALGPQVHAQFLQGCAGNIRPRATADLEARRFRPVDAEIVRKTGRELADAVLRASRGEGRGLSLDLAASTRTVQLARGRPPARSLYEELAKGTDHRARAARYWLAEYDRGGPPVTSVPWKVGVVRLSPDQWICWMSGEPVVEWAALVQEWFGARAVLTLGYTQEVFGYLPVDEILSEGGYEVISANQFRAGNPAPFAPGMNAAIRRAVREQLEAITPR